MSECFEQRVEKAGNVKSPFSRQLVVDFYDGTMAALVQCGVCGRTYSCFMIDSDKKRMKRIFALYPIDPEALRRLTELSADIGARPNWPYWVAHVPVEVGEALFPKSMEILKSANVPEWIIAADSYIETIFAVKRVPTALFPKVAESIERWGAFDWFAFLGIQREADVGPPAAV